MAGVTYVTRNEAGANISGKIKEIVTIWYKWQNK
jgi:hypothetical protein